MISHNLANVDTPGFKRELAYIEPRDSEAVETGLVSAEAEDINNLSGGLRLESSMTDFSLGALRSTGVSTDLAIEGENAFFMVNKDGQQFLTRAGNFTVDPNGTLTTQQGYPVLSTNGDEINLEPGDWRLLPGGRIEQNGAAVDLALVQPGSLGDLARVGENLFRPLAPTQTLLAPNERPNVRQGHLEMSSVKPTTEMMDMINASRAYEANIRMIQHNDSVLGSLLSRVLRQN